MSNFGLHTYMQATCMHSYTHPCTHMNKYYFMHTIYRKENRLGSHYVVLAGLELSI